MNPAIHAALEKLHIEVASGNPEDHLAAYIAADAMVEKAITETKSRVLKSALAWGNEGQALAARASSAMRELGAIGLLLAERCESCGVKAERETHLQEALLLTLANFGSAARWSCMLRREVAPPPFRAIHAHYRRIDRFGFALKRATIVRDGIARTLTAEAQYLRVLLLPLLCHRSLDPQQLEVLDQWLWDWVGEYWLTREHEEGQPTLWVDLDGADGLNTRICMHAENVRHVGLDKIGAQLRHVQGLFHEGRIPGTGCASEFPVEAYTGVLDHLQQLWDRLRSGDVQRRAERRVHDEPPAVQAFIGLPIANAQHDIASESARPVRVHDESDRGAGLLVEATMFEQAQVGDLVNVRMHPGAPPFVGTVVRKFPCADGRFAIGVDWIARSPRNLYMNEIHPITGNLLRRVACLYVADADVSGRFDTLVVDETTFLDGNRYELEFDDRTFEIRLNRLVRRGRGWVCAGYEVVGARKRKGLSLAFD